MLYNVYMFVCGLIIFCVGTVGVAYYMHCARKSRYSDVLDYLLAGIMMIGVCVAAPFGGFIFPALLAGGLLMLPVYLLSRAFDKVGGLSLKTLKEKLKERL